MHDITEYKPAIPGLKKHTHITQLYKMPDLEGVGIPPVLLTMMDSLLRTCGDIKSWSVYDNSHGNINLNIRFSNVDVCNVDSHVVPVVYKRLSPRQCDRNKQRAETFKSKQQPRLTTNTQTQVNSQTQTEHLNDNTTNKKRKINASPISPEKSRCDNYDSNNFKSIDTPVKIATHEVEYQVADDKESAVLKEYDSGDSKEEYVSDDSASTVESDEYEIPPDEVMLPFPSTIPEYVQPNTNHHVLCPCCDREMKPNHICDSSNSEPCDTDSLNKHKQNFMEAPCGTRWASRLPKESDNCNHMQPCMFCDNG